MISEIERIVKAYGIINLKNNGLQPIKYHEWRSGYEVIENIYNDGIDIVCYDKETGVKMDTRTGSFEYIPKKILTEVFIAAVHQENKMDNGSDGDFLFDDLVEAVLDDMKKQIELEDWTAIDELIRFVPRQNLIWFLGEEKWEKYNELVS